MSAIDWKGRALAPSIKLFGETLTFTPTAGTPQDVKGIFNEAHEEVHLIDDVPVSTVMPTAKIILSDLSQEPVQGDLIIRQETGETYRIRDVRPDGHGGLFLLLNFDHSS